MYLSTKFLNQIHFPTSGSIEGTSFISLLGIHGLIVAFLEMATVWCFFAFLAVVVVAAPNSNSSSALPIGALDAQDVAHFLAVFSDFSKDSIKDAHYAYIGDSVFNRNILDGLSCDHLKSHFDSLDAEMQYYALSAARGVRSCTVSVSIRFSYFLCSVCLTFLSPS